MKAAFLAAGAAAAVLLATAPAASAAVPAQVAGVTLSPQATGAAVGDGRINVSWPGVTGAAGYFVNYGLVGGGTSSISVIAPSSSSTNVQATLSGLTGGSTYVVTVQAVNASGRGAESNPGTSTPITVPTAPTDIDAATSGSTTTVSWTQTPASLNGGATITSYSVTLTNSTTGEVATATSTGMESAAYESLAEGNYQVQLRAVNSAGSSTAAIATVTVSKSSSGEPESSAGATTNPPANATTGPGGVITPGATGATTPSGKPVAVLPAKVSAQAGKATRTSITLNQPVLLKDLVLVLVNKAGKRSTVDATFKRSGSTKVIASYKAPTKAGSYTLVLYRKVGSKRVLLDSSRLVVKG